MWSSIRGYSLFQFLASFDFYFPIKIIYFHHLTNSYSLDAIILSVSWISAALMEVPTGIFSDLVGRKRTIILGSICSMMAFLLYALGFSYWVLLLGAFFEGTTRAFYSGNNNAYLHNVLADQGKEKDFHTIYGKISSLSLVAGSTAGLLSGVLIYWSVAYFMWVNLIPKTLAFLTAIFLKEIKQEERVNTNIYSHLKESFKEVGVNTKLRYLSLASIFSGAGAAAYEFQASVFNAVWPTWAIGIARWMIELLVVPGFYFAGRLINRFGAVNLVLLGSLTTWLGNILAGLSQSFISPLIIVVTHITYGPGDTSNQTLLQKEFTERQRATIASLNSLGSSIYFSIVINICGVIANQHGPFLALILTQIFYLPVIYFQYKLFRSRQI